MSEERRNERPDKLYIPDTLGVDQPGIQQPDRIGPMINSTQHKLYLSVPLSASVDTSGVSSVSRR